MIKDFKRVISMILVAAMLASFAGMTGYQYSPAAIKAEAANGVGDEAYIPYGQKAIDSFAYESLMEIVPPAPAYTVNGTTVAGFVDKNGNGQRDWEDFNGNGTCDGEEFYKEEILNTAVAVKIPVEGLVQVRLMVGSDKANLTTDVWGGAATGTWCAANLPKSSDGKSYVYAGGEELKDRAFNTTDKAIYMCLEADVKKNYIKEDGSFEEIVVTYKQYAASYVVAVPRYKLVEMMYYMNDNGSGTNNAATFYQRINMIPFLQRSGFVLDTVIAGEGDVSGRGGILNGGTASFSSGDNQGNFASYIAGEKIWINSSTGYTHFGSGHDAYSSTVYNSPRYFGDWYTTSGNAKKRDDYYINYGDGKQEDNLSGYLTAHATVYFDPRRTSAISVPLLSLWSEWERGNGSEGNSARLNGTQQYNFRELSSPISSSNPWYGNWNSADANFADITLSSTFAEPTYDTPAAWYGYKFVDLTFSANVFDATKNKYYFAMFQPQTTNKTTFYLRFPYTFTFVPKSREVSHTFIEKVWAANFIEAEMSPTWWTNYRDSVYAAFLNLGALTTRDDTVNDSVIDKPQYLLTNYTQLVNAVKNTPDYERGNLANNTATNKYQMGIAYKNLGYMDATDSAGKTYSSVDFEYNGGYFYTEDTWAAFEIARNNATALMFFPWSHLAAKEPGRRNFGYDIGMDDHSGNTGAAGCACYLQDRVNAMVDTLNTARANLTLKAADYSMLEKAISTAVKDGDSDSKYQHIANNYDGTYIGDGLTFKLSGNDYTGKYYAPDGSEKTITAGTYYPYDYYDKTLADAFITKLRNRLNAYDWTGADSNGIPNNLYNENLATDYHLGINPGYNKPYPISDISAADAKTYEDRLSGTPSHYYLAISYQTVIDKIKNDIETASDALRLSVQPQKLGGLIEAAKYAEDGTTLYRDIQSNINTQYIPSSYNKYEDHMNLLVQVLLANAQTPFSWAVKYNNLTTAIDGDYSANEPIYSELEIVLSDGTTTIVYPANRQEEYNYAVESAQYVEKLLKKYADYSVLLELLNGADDIPAYDTNGSAGVTGGGAKWYTKATWDRFEAARNALVVLTSQGEGGAKTFDFATGLANDGVGSYSRGTGDEDLQPTIDAAVKEYNDAFAALALKKVEDYVDGDENSYTTIIETLTNKLNALKNNTVDVSTVVEQDGTYVIDEDAVKRCIYNPTEVAKLEEMLNAVIAIEKTLDLDKDNKAALEAAISAYNAQYKFASESKNTAGTDGWDGITAHLGALAGVEGFDTTDILTKFGELYVEYDADGNVITPVTNGPVYKKLDAAIKAYNALDKSSIDNQDAVNAQVEALFEALNSNQLQSKAMHDAIVAAEKEGNDTFVVYNPYNLGPYKNKHNLYLYKEADENSLDGLANVSKYTELSVSKLKTEIDAAKAGNYNLYTTPVATMNNDANILLTQAGIAGDKAVSGYSCLLVGNKVDLTVLNAALVGANTAINMAKVTAENPAGDNYSYPRYSAKTVAELQAVVAMAQAVVDNADTANLDFTNQLMIDKLVFQIFDEIENGRVLLNSEPKDDEDNLYDHWTWTYKDADGNVTTDEDAIVTAECAAANEEYYTDAKWDSLIHKTLNFAGDDNGLLANKAYYAFVDEQIKGNTIIKTTTNEDGEEVTTENTKFIGLVWDENGNILLDEKGREVGSITFTNWDTYKEALTAAKEIDRTLTSTDQEKIDTIAANLYKARNNLKANYYSSNTEQFEQTTEWYNNELAKYVNATTNITRYGFTDDGLPTSYEKSVKIYTFPSDEVETELLAMIATFRANYADMNTEMPYDSIEQATIDKQAIMDYISEKGIVLKKTDDPSFRVGAEDLVQNFIAGTPKFVDALIAGGVYTAGSYDSNLIAKTEADWDGGNWLQGSQGYTIDAHLTNIYGMFNPDNVADSTFGGSLQTFTDILYNYVTDENNPAKNLQFAVHMRDNELYNMLTSQFFVGNESFGKDLSFYYGTENAGADDTYGSYTLKEYVFDQERVYDDIILFVDDFFATDDSWPLIYQVNGMTYSTSDEWGQQIACSIDGYEFIDGSYQYTGEGTAPASEKIIDILNEVGSHSGYYSTAFKAANINSYATDHYAWINDENGIFYTDTTSGIKYILASENNADACPKAYDVSVESGHWYTDGKGKLINGNRYYVFENNADITGSAHKSWFENSSYETLTNNLSDSYILEFFNTKYVDITTTDLAGADIGKLNNPDNPAEGASALFFINDIKENGWSPMSQEYFIIFVNTEQGIIDQLVAKQYVDIQNLKLLPAYDAYREVVELYHNVYYGQTVKYAAGSTNVIPGTNDTITEIENAVFYRYDNDEGKSDIALLEENYDRIGVVYGNDTITGSPYLRGTTKALPDAYYIKNDDASKNLVTFYSNDKDNTSFAYSAIYSPVTIDRADEVNGNYTNDNKSFKAQFIDLFVELNIVELKFDKLDELVNAFFNNYTDENGITYGLGKDNQTFKTNHGLEGKFYTYDMYTPESLQAVLQVLHEIKVDGVDSYISIISNDLYKAASDDTYVYSTVYDRETYGGSIYDEAKTQPVVDAAHAKLAEALSTLLVLKPAEMDELDEIVAKSDIAVENDGLYSKTATDSEGNNYWEVFEAALAEAKKYYKEDGTYKDGLTFAEDQEDINKVEYNLSTAYANLKKVGDKTAPEMTIGTSAADMDIFYTQEVVDLDDSVAKVGDAPATGTYILPVVGGQSLRVYTNELNPRIVIQLQDVASETVLYSKPERMSIAATKTSGAVANVITGTETKGNITGVLKSTLTSQAVNFETAAKETDGTYDDNSSIFAILSPTFQAGGAQRQAVQYTINANDSAEDQKNIDGEKPQNNNVTELTFNNGASVSLGAESSKGITVYIYYMNNMTADGSDEGVTSTGAVAKSAWGTDASVVLSANEVLGASKWINTYYLQRKYNSTVKSWDFVDANKEGCVNYVEGSESNVNGPVYNDPNFGITNTGSFAYVLDETADAEVINTYFENKKTTETMDYAAATLAKKEMLESITAEKFAEMKASGRYTKYGAYDNWTQMFGQCSNGDLIFVHVLDRWGNVVNRIIEVTKYDNGISVSSSGAGEATVTEKDGSGLASISIWNYLDNNSTNVEYADGVAVEENNKVSVSAGVGDESGLEIVSVSDNVFTVAGLRAGIGYRIGAADNAGNVAYINVRTDSEGKFTITVDTASEKVDTGEDTSVTENAVTFMLNNTAVITLNTGIGSSIVDAELEGNVFAGKKITHYITTEAGVTQLKVVNLADNTEEIFTSEKTKVTTNDDGTLKWATKRTLTEGEHNFRVYAMTDGEYESVGVKFTINATTKAVPLTFSVIGVGRTVLEFSGSAPAINSTYRSTTVPYGAKVKIVAQETKENCNFYYWQNDDTDRIVTTANTIEYTAVTAVDYNALFTNSASINSGMKLVIYVNNAKNVIKTFELYEGDDYIIPVGPSLPDYTFKGWSMSKAEVLASEKDTVIVEPVYVLTAENTVTITEGDYTTSGAGNYTATETERALATISASATNGAGEEFLYWFDEGTKDIVSYDRTYSFICIKDIVLTPVYGDASTINAQPVIRISNVVFDGASNKVNFYAERSVGAGYTLLQTGIVVTKTAAIAENADAFVVDGASTATGVSNQTTNYGSYSASVKLSAEETVWARAYAICETDDGEIIEVYSDAVSYTNS